MGRSGEYYKEMTDRETQWGNVGRSGGSITKK